MVRGCSMKRLLVFIILILIALLFILNWKDREQIVCCVKEKSEKAKCSAKSKYQQGKDWAEQRGFGG